MKQKKTALDLLDELQQLSLPRSELLAFTAELIRRFDLSLADCFSREAETLAAQKALFCELLKIFRHQTAEMQRVLDVFDPKPLAELIEEEKTAPPAQTSLQITDNPVEQATVHPKGFSKNGKKLGRPPGAKNKKQKQHLPKADALSKDINKKQSSAQQQLSEEEMIETLKYGKTYSIDALYLWNGSFIRTNRLMESAQPIGVIIPFIRHDAKREIVVYYTDEIGGITVSQAAQYARNKLPVYCDRRWRVKTRADDSIWSQTSVRSEINQMFKKMGGDPLQGEYLDGRGFEYTRSSKKLKIRYVCDIPIEE